MEIDKKSFKKMFPKLSDELELEDNKIPISSVRTDADATEKAAPEELRHFNPTVIDFVRRCNTEAEAEDIITYLEKRRELNEEYAEKLRKQLRKEGVRSFGSKKEENYYFKKGGIC